MLYDWKKKKKTTPPPPPPPTNPKTLELKETQILQWYCSFGGLCI